MTGGQRVSRGFPRHTSHERRRCIRGTITWPGGDDCVGAGTRRRWGGPRRVTAPSASRRRLGTLGRPASNQPRIISRSAREIARHRHVARLLRIEPHELDDLALVVHDALVIAKVHELHHEGVEPGVLREDRLHGAPPGRGRREGERAPDQRLTNSHGSAWVWPGCSDGQE